MGHGGVQLRVFVQNSSGLLCSRPCGGKGRLQNECLLSSLRFEFGLVATVPTHRIHDGLHHLEVEMVFANGATTEGHRTTLSGAAIAGVSNLA